MKKFETKFTDVKMLIVEDYDFSMEILVEMLRLMGIEPDTAKNGEEAIEKAKIKKYDLILMDILMPKVDGYEATMSIRKLSIEQPIITALTASVQEEDKKKCLDAGMNDFLAKPMNIDALENHLKHHLSSKLVNRNI
ncbi:MAG: response regulator [Parachlamydiaceae bacterium]|nr:response regulator [Parachlamydiaceae bacterium]